MKDTCLNCFSLIAIVQQRGGHAVRTPKEGDYSVCARCGQIGTFDKEMNIDPVTDEKLEWVLNNWPHIYQDIIVAGYMIEQQYKTKIIKMKKLFIDIHIALHSNAKQVKINGTKTEITKDTNGMRTIVFMDEGKEWEIIQQNPNTRSLYAQRARDGEKISWLIPRMLGFRKQDGWKVITSTTQAE